MLTCAISHVYGFLEEIGQGVQHAASRVENLIEFVQKCNEMREVTGEVWMRACFMESCNCDFRAPDTSICLQLLFQGFTFLSIPRSYYGTLTTEYLVSTAEVPEGIASTVFEACKDSGIMGLEGAVDLDITESELDDLIGSVLEPSEADKGRKEKIVSAIRRSRFRNVYALLQDKISEQDYLGIVRNQILIDVQGSDILYQIFTCNILQREQGEEAPFLEFIQRVCAVPTEGLGRNIKPGCGGFG